MSVVVNSKEVGMRRLGAHHAEATIREAFERGRHLGLLIGADWEALLDEPREAMRERLGISPPPSYEPVPRPGEPPLPVPALRDLLGGFFARAPAH